MAWRIDEMAVASMKGVNAKGGWRWEEFRGMLYVGKDGVAWNARCEARVIGTGFAGEHLRMRMRGRGRWVDG